MARSGLGRVTFHPHRARKPLHALYAVISISRWTRPLVLLATLADLTLHGIKALIDRLLGPKEIARIRRLLRR